MMARFSGERMNEVEHVALWTGLLASVVGIVLSIVAIVSSILTNIRLEAVTDQTIRSLQKIESDVARISEETSGLIKAGWERMLGSVGGEGSSTTAESKGTAREIAAGLTNEIREALNDARKSGDLGATDRLPRVEEALRELRRTIAAQMSGPSAGRSGRFNLDPRIARLPSLARELAYQIRYHHLTRDQYEQLRKDELVGPAVRQLRRAGLLVPLANHGDEETRVYWFPPGRRDEIISAVLLTGRRDPNSQDIIGGHLKAIGYVPDHEEAAAMDAAKQMTLDIKARTPGI
jgi:hypothetical protein